MIADNMERLLSDLEQLYPDIRTIEHKQEEGFFKRSKYVPIAIRKKKAKKWSQHTSIFV